MHESSSNVKENIIQGEEITRKKPFTLLEEINENVKVTSTSIKEVKNTEFEFKTPEKNQHQLIARNITEIKTPERSKKCFDLKSEEIGSCDTDNGLISTAEQARLLIAACVPKKAVENTESEFKTPEKNQPNELIEHNVKEKKNDITPEKRMKLEEIESFDKEDGLISTTEQARLIAASVPKKAVENTESEFKTPEKNQSNELIEHNVKEKKNDITPEKRMKLEEFESFDKEDGLISTTEQARLLIAASRTPSKSINKTPVKQSNTPTGKRSLENSPVTPGKHRRVELITLASPKAKRIKQM